MEIVHKNKLWVTIFLIKFAQILVLKIVWERLYGKNFKYDIKNYGGWVSKNKWRINIFKPEHTSRGRLEEHPEHANSNIWELWMMRSSGLKTKFLEAFLVFLFSYSNSYFLWKCERDSNWRECGGYSSGFTRH